MAFASDTKTIESGRSGTGRGDSYSRRLRVAYFSPLPPARTGIADYSRELLPYLTEYLDLTLFVPDPDRVDPEFSPQYSIQPVSRYPEQRWRFDMSLYQMGNSDHHEEMYQMFRRYPGVLVLHDYFVHTFIADRTVGKGEFAAYVREMGYSRGLSGTELAAKILAGSAEHPEFEWPLNERLLDLSLGIAVHSQYVKGLVGALPAERPVDVITMPMERFDAESKRQDLPWSGETIIFASVGQVTAAKQIERALRAFKLLHQQRPATAYLIVGEPAPDIDLEQMIVQMGLEASVYTTGHVSELSDFLGWIATADVIVNLRYPTAGETSATALRALAAGKPLIVCDHGWYSELPDDACLKVSPLSSGELLDAMLMLAGSPSLREALGQAGIRYVDQHCRPTIIAQAYTSFLQEIVGNCRIEHA